MIESNSPAPTAEKTVHDVLHNGKAVPSLLAVLRNHYTTEHGVCAPVQQRHQQKETRHNSLQKHPNPHCGSMLHAMCKPWYLRA